MEIIIFCTYLIIENKRNYEQYKPQGFFETSRTRASVAGLAFAGCEKAAKKGSTDNVITGDIPEDKMTYRVNPKTGEKSFSSWLRVHEMAYGFARKRS